MATEDAATVLESFIHDTANLPAEIAHLLEEMQAKDAIMAESREYIASCDHQLQKHVKENGGSATKHTEEDAWAKSVLSNYDRVQKLQDEKSALANKAASLLDRHIKRLDIKIRDLQTHDSTLAFDSLPSLLRPPSVSITNGSLTGLGALASHPSITNPSANGVSPTLTSNAAANPNSLTTHIGVARMTSGGRTAPPNAPMAGMTTHPLLNSTQQRHFREGSAASEGSTKKRRLNGGLGPLPNPGSQLARHSSLGPGGTTPKAGTPGASSSRAGSAGPGRVSKKTNKKSLVAAQGLVKKKHKSSKKHTKSSTLQGRKATPSTTGDDEESASDASEGSQSASVASSVPQSVATDKRNNKDNKNKAAVEDRDVEMEDGVVNYDEEGEDNRLYCVCQKQSHGDMVACDNEKCDIEWFHWQCVGLTHEPKGRWLCPKCEKLPKSQVKFAR